ncbi:MAG: hypothetical protein ACRD51_04375 [Candidatus Acidiferrum sp.]
MRKQFCYYVGKCKRINNRSIQEDRTRKLRVPVRVLIVDGDFIPWNAPTCTAVRPWLARVTTQLARQLLSEEVVLIPVLRDP